MDGITKIVLTGPESSGKTWLCKELSKHFQSPWIPEYARLHLEKTGPQYSYHDLIQIAQEHLEYQAIHLPTTGLVFLDTDMINFSVWEDVVFKTNTPWIDEKIQTETDHKYLITSPDLPWENDPLRENPSDLQMLFDKHLQTVKNQHRPFKIIKGANQNRLNQAIKAVNFFLGDSTNTT
jgi:nicotinamide riboside kinase